MRCSRVKHVIARIIFELAIVCIIIAVPILAVIALAFGSFSFFIATIACLVFGLCSMKLLPNNIIGFNIKPHKVPCLYSNYWYVFWNLSKFEAESFQLWLDKHTVTFGGNIELKSNTAYAVPYGEEGRFAFVIQRERTAFDSKAVHLYDDVKFCNDSASISLSDSVDLLADNTADSEPSQETQQTECPEEAEVTAKGG